MVHSFYSSRRPSGENLVVRAEVETLRRAGHEVELFAVHTDAVEGELAYRLRAGLRVATGLGRHPLRAMAEFGPDIVHVHNLFPNYSRRWLKDVAAPVVHTLHNYRPLCANGLLYRDRRPCTECLDGDRWAGWRHGCYRDSRLTTLPVTLAGCRGAEHDPLIARADALIAVSAAQRAVFIRSGLPASRVVVGPNFLPDTDDPGPQFGPRDPVWVFVGRLSDEKGIVELVEAWPVGERLIVIGAGPHAEQLAVKAPEGVHLMGGTDRAGVMDALSRAHGLIFPSRSPEIGSPLAYIEALAVAAPVLAFDGNAVADGVRADATGRVCGWEDDLDTVLAVARSSFDDAMRRRCRAVFEERHSERVFLRDRVALYERLLAGVTL
jgi:glycosyltransferase involved in cell wall biosynthesis